VTSSYLAPTAPTSLSAWGNALGIQCPGEQALKARFNPAFRPAKRESRFQRWRLDFQKTWGVALRLQIEYRAFGAKHTATGSRQSFSAEPHAHHCTATNDAIHLRMTTYPKSPKEVTRGMMYFPRMLDKIRLHLRGELHEDYRENFGAPKAADGVCCNFLRVHHRDLIERVKQGGTDEEILEWCFEKGRRLNDGDLFVWNGFASKLGWRDSITPRLEQRKKEMGIADRNDIQCIPDLIDFDEGRKS